jgi:hypothetical protein
MLSARFAFVLALAGLASARQQPPAPSAEAPKLDPTGALPPRAAIAGLAGFECVSILEYAADPATPHELTCTYVFPARARWQIRVRGREELGRSIEYRCGETYFVLSQSEGRSTEISARSPHGDQVAAKCEMFELRRAAFLWPDGFDWTTSGDVRRAPSSCGRTLVARIDDNGRPRELHFDPSGGSPGERLVIRAWKQRHERWWPQELELWFAAERIWSERVESLSPSLALLDLYFAPPDRRAPAQAGDAAPAVRHIDAPERCEVRVELPQAAEWSAVADLWKSEFARLAQRLPAGWSSSPGAHVELADDGRPKALLFRLRGEGDPPTGATVSAPAQGLIYSQRWPPVNLERSLATLRRAAPSGSRVTHWYATFADGFEAPPSEVQLVALLGGVR